MIRSLLFYFGTKEGTVVPWNFGHININKTISEVLSDLTFTNNIVADRAELPLIAEASSLYDLFDWNNNFIPLNTPVRKIAKPGVVFAIHKEIEDPQARAYSLMYFAVNQKEPNQKQILESYLHGERGEFTPRDFDIFISYSEEDEEVAKEIMGLFENKNISCFMAKKDIKTGAVWENEIRTILLDVIAAIVIITPKSLVSKWVMCEAGAMWVLNKPIFPALMFVDPDKLPELITKHQAVDITTTTNRNKLCNDVTEYCNIYDREKPAT